jgi:ABC transport system ATP-binding/permease protein
MTSALPTDFEGEADRPLRIGRALDNDIVLNYPMVSAYHALLSPLGEGRFTVIDLESTNGTFLNTWGEQITNGQEVGEENVLFFGSYRFPVRQLHPVSLWRHPREDRLPTREVLTIGRATENDLVLDYPQISSYHARFYRRNGLYAIEDLGSANGTFVNGLPIQQPTPVTVLDMIALGPYIIEIDPEGFLRIRDFRGEMRIDAQDISLLVKDRQSGRPLPLLDHISTTFYPSEFVGLMGPSGAGKTTLLLVLNGYQLPSAGRVLINGYDLYHHYDLFRGTIGYVPQDDIVHKDLTVYQSLFYTARLRLPTDTPHRTIRQRIEEVLQQLNLWEHQIGRAHV